MFQPKCSYAFSFIKVFKSLGMFSKRDAIIDLHEGGGRVHEISRNLNVPKSTASKAIKLYQELGDTSDRLRSAGPHAAADVGHQKSVIKL